MPGDAQWERIKQLFAQAQEVPTAERDEWWRIARNGEDPAVVAEVASLLAAQAQEAPLLDGDAWQLIVAAGGECVDADSSDAWLGKHLGVYRIDALLGQGGMGSVFLAQRTDGQFVRHVALKLIRTGYDSPALRERFLRERQILARLQHAHIAQLYDGGVAADGSPYFTLEYVDGLPITRYCDAQRLDLEARLRLLLKVCAAVEYAHAKLVVHRDLKPSNILVTAQGDVKLLDFGIAKLVVDEGELAPHTATQMRLMTREYAAPEQVLAQPVTTATDVYALGVLAYELLCGHLPYAGAERGEVSWPKAIVDEAPQSLNRALTRDTSNPSLAEDIARDRSVSLGALQRCLRGDLDHVVQRALEKTPEARYASIGALARDIDAWLAGQALPGTTRRRRLGKFLWRHRVAASLTAALLISIAIGAGALLWQVRETLLASQRALYEARNTAAVKDILLGLFSAADPRTNPGGEVSVREALDRGAQSIEMNNAAAPALKAELQITLGQIYFQLGLFAQAAAQFDGALAMTRNVPALQRLAAQADREAAGTQMSLGDREKARRHAQSAVARLRALVPRSPGDEIAALQQLAIFLVQEGEFAEAVPLAEEAIALARTSDAPAELLADALKARAGAHTRQLQFGQAEPLIREALALHTTALGEHDARVGSDRHDLVLVLRATGRHAEAIRLLEHGLAVMGRAYGENSLHLIAQQVQLAGAYSGYGELGQAEALARRALASALDAEGRDGANAARVLNMLGVIQTRLGQMAPAEESLREALRIRALRPQVNRSAAVAARSNLAEVQTSTGRYVLAEQQLHEVLAAEQAAGDIEFIWTWQRLSEVRRLQGDVEQALHFGRLARDQALALHGENSLQGAWTHYSYGLALAANEQTQEAESALRRSMASFDFIRPDRLHPDAALPRLALAQLLIERGAGRDEALRLCDEAVRARQLALGVDHAYTRAAREVLDRARAVR